MNTVERQNEDGLVGERDDRLDSYAVLSNHVVGLIRRR